MRNGAAHAHRLDMEPSNRQTDEVDSSPAEARGRRLPATQLRVRREDRRSWTLFAIALHALVIFLLTRPEAPHTADVREIQLGAGGAGPAGGGGGGHQGTGGVQERVHFVQVVSQVAPPPKAVVVPPPKPKPVVVPPKPVTPPPTPEPQVKQPEVKVEPAKPAAEAQAPTPGTGGGTGKDGSAGSGPGSGGGVGSGTGTGKGSGVGPGTGGGVQQNYPPTPIAFFIPPLPMPDKVRGFHMIAEFDVDETGKVVSYHFSPTKDDGYNRRVDEVLKNFKFKPGTKPDGTPIRMKAQITYDF